MGRVGSFGGIGIGIDLEGHLEGESCRSNWSTSWPVRGAVPPENSGNLGGGFEKGFVTDLARVERR